MKLKSLTANERKLQAEWETLVKRHSKPLERGAQAKGIRITASVLRPPTTEQLQRAGSDLYAHPSRGAPSGVATKAKDKVYTGSDMLGVATMHKSNSVPVFRKEDAVDISKMRR